MNNKIVKKISETRDQLGILRSKGLLDIIGILGELNDDNGHANQRQEQQQEQIYLQSLERDS